MRRPVPASFITFASETSYNAAGSILLVQRMGQLLARLSHENQG